MTLTGQSVSQSVSDSVSHIIEHRADSSQLKNQISFHCPFRRERRRRKVLFHLVLKGLLSRKGEGVPLSCYSESYNPKAHVLSFQGLLQAAVEQPCKKLSG